MVKQIILTQNNFGIPIELQFVSDTNSPIDLTDKIVEVAISYDGTIIDVLQATISSYTNGTAYIIVNTRHTSNAGLYTTFWSVKDKYGYITAQEDLYYYVKEEYNGAETPGIEQDKETIEETITTNVLNSLNSKIDTFQENVSNDLQAKKLELDNIIKGMNKCSELHYINSIADESCVLFKCMNGETVLVDCGEPSSSGGLYNRLKALGVTKINHFIITHFHSDHVGGYNIIFDNFVVDNVYFKPITWTLSAKEIGWQTKTLYDGFRTKLNQLNIKYYSLTEDTIIDINDKEKIKIMNTAVYPYGDKSGVTEYSVYDYNYESLMCLYTNGNAKVLLQSDCPSQVAYNNYSNTIMNVDHLQISHHGGNDVINSTWINSIRAKTGFYSYLNSTNIEFYKAYSFTKLYRYDFNSSFSGCILITDGGLYTTISMIENKLSDRFLDYLDKKVYIDSSGDMVENGIINNGNKMYIIKDYYKQFPSADGWCYAFEDQAYALNSDGSIKRNQWVSTSGHNFYVDDQGIFLKNVSYKVGTTDVTFNAEGHANI